MPLVADTKRLIGRKYDDATVQSDIKNWPFEVTNDNSKPKITVQVRGKTKTYYPEEVKQTIFRFQLSLMQYFDVNNLFFLDFFNSAAKNEGNRRSIFGKNR